MRVDNLGTPRPPFARGLVFKTFERSAYLMRVDIRANVAYGAAWAVLWEKQFAQGEHEAAACTLSLRDVR
jgi:hypothetical protein